jgi:hypothetical protein
LFYVKTPSQRCLLIHRAGFVELHENEISLRTVRAEKHQYADKLIDVMADYEKRKTDILNGIAKLVGEDPVDIPPSPSGQSRKSSDFTGF